MTHYPLIVFTDFDGTITKNETLEEFVQLFMDENIQTVAQKLLDSGYSIKEGVKKIISSIPTEQYKQNRNFFQGLPIRSGFTEFVNFLHSKNIPLVVLSGGIKAM